MAPMTLNNIGIVVALEQEASLLIDQLELQLCALADNQLPCLAFSGRYSGLNINLIVCGRDPDFDVACIGTLHAALATQTMIRQFQPDLIINPGTCGAFQYQGSRIGDVYLSERIRFLDRRISTMPQVRQWAEGHFTSDVAHALARQTGMAMAVVCTGDSIPMSAADEETLRSEPLVAKEMEAASIARVASIYHVPMFAIKVVTDFLDSQEGTGIQFNANLKVATRNLTCATARLLRLLSE